VTVPFPVDAMARMEIFFVLWSLIARYRLAMATSWKTWRVARNDIAMGMVGGGGGRGAELERGG
jgi:hypothetical protein